LITLTIGRASTLSSRRYEHRFWRICRTEWILLVRLGQSRRQTRVSLLNYSCERHFDLPF